MTLARRFRLPVGATVFLALGLPLPDTLMRQGRAARLDAVLDLCQLGPDAQAARPSLRLALGDEDPDVRAWAAICLGRMGNADDATVRGLVQAIEHLRPGVQNEAVAALHKSGALLAWLSRSECFGSCPSYSVYVLKDGALLYLGHSSVLVEGFRKKQLSPAQVDGLVRAFREADYFSLDDSYTAPVTDAPSVVTGFSRDGRTKQVDHYLGHPGPKALQRLEQRFDEIVGSAAWVGTADAFAAKEREEAAARAAAVARMPGLVVALGDPRPEARWSAARDLYSTAPTTQHAKGPEWQLAASRVLAEALGDGDEEQRFLAAQALFAGGELAPEAVDALMKSGSDPSPRIRVEAYRALHMARPTTEAALAVLVERLASPVFEEDQLAAAILGNVGAAAAPAVPALTRALRHTDSRVRNRAASALSSIGPGAAAATLALVELLREDPDAGVRAAAAFALSRIGPGASAALPALQAALTDPAPRVRDEAASALRAIAPR